MISACTYSLSVFLYVTQHITMFPFSPVFSFLLIKLPENGKFTRGPHEKYFMEWFLMFRNLSGSINVVNLIKENGGSWHLDSAVFIPNIMREEAKYLVKPGAGRVDRVPVIALQSRDPHPRVYPACFTSDNSAVSSMSSSPSPLAFLRSGKCSVGGVRTVIRHISRTQIRISVALLFPQQSLRWDNFVLCSCPVIFTKLQSYFFETTYAL